MLELTQAAVHLSFGGRLLFAFSVRVFCNDESVILTKMKHYGRCVCVWGGAYRIRSRLYVSGASELISSFGLSASLMDFYPFGLSLLCRCLLMYFYYYALLFLPLCCVNFVFVLRCLAAFVFLVLPLLFYYGHTFIYCACVSLWLTPSRSHSLSRSSLGHLFIFVSCFRRCVVGAFININEFCSMKVKLKFTWAFLLLKAPPALAVLSTCAACVCASCMMKTCSNF